MASHSHTNNLIKETSPYLLQHAHNPVDWHPWSEKVLTKAKAEGKLLLISIGYSACHWCHVMEKECFEKEGVAEVMNSQYINVKIDREEFPDVDLVYMNALQLMTGSGGWPLNIVALSDGRPVWGCTYLPKKNWTEALTQIHTLHKQQPEKLEEYATNLSQGLKTMNVIAPLEIEPELTELDLEKFLQKWKTQLDPDMGGSKGAPKFMMPDNYKFLLRAATQTQDKELEKHVNLTLTKMAYGGLFDHVDGGFSRYSVDAKWHVPHFEKMLYDNAQLVSLYSDAYSLTGDPLYKEVVYETLQFIKKELTHDNGGFFSALDADSLNEAGILEEGAYYVFTKAEIEELLTEDLSVVSEYYNINEYGKWEEDKYVLIRNKSDREIAAKFSLSEEELQAKKNVWKKTLSQHRSYRSRPRKDIKILTSWNALMQKAYLDAYRVFKEPSFLKAAEKNANFLINNQIRENGTLFRNYTNKKSNIEGYLEDYAAVIDAFISLYENTLDEKWLKISKTLIEFTIENFLDKESGLFYFSSQNNSLLEPVMETRDNVIPASNSIHALNLFKMGAYFGKENYKKMAVRMLKNILPNMEDYPPAYSNWANLWLNLCTPFYEVVITGPRALENLIGLNKYYLPNVLKAGCISANNSHLTRGRFVDGKTVFYVCKKNTCLLPVASLKEVLDQLN